MAAQVLHISTATVSRRKAALMVVTADAAGMSL
jgi:hypothetical protein